MFSSRAVLSVGLLVGLALLAGCGTLLGGDQGTQSTPTVTPVPISEVTQTASPTPDDEGTDALGRSQTTQSGQIQQRYQSLRPNCARPPGLVIHVQVGALRTNDAGTNAGINTTWRFAAPSNKRQTGPLPRFVETIKSYYRPLLAAETVEYGRMEVTDETARRNVTVGNATGGTTTYVWRLQQQSGGRLDGCWMTTGVGELD